MKFLADTHAIIWFITNDKKLPLEIKRSIELKENSCYVSIASYWEMGIKYSMGQLNLESNLKEIFKIIKKSGLELLAITPDHILRNSLLPFHHKDPFDRIIIAQAMEENLTLVSKDSEFSKYEIPILWN